MNVHQIFDSTGLMTMVCWLVLIVAYRNELIVKMLLWSLTSTYAVLYGFLIFSNLDSFSLSSFSSLSSIRLAFQSDELLMAGWLHYLAFDFFVGVWMVQKAKTEMIPHLLILPSLFLTFLFGPLGLFAFYVTRLSWFKVLSKKNGDDKQ